MSFTSARTGLGRDAWIAVLARAVSFLGDGLASVVLVLRLQDDGADAWAVATLLTTAMLPLVLAAPLAGRLADRFPSRPLLVGSSLLQSGLCAVLAFVDPLGPSLVLIAAIGVGQAINGSTWQALLPTLVAPDRLPRAVAAVQTGSTLAGVAAPALAGLLIELTGPRVPLLIDAGSFLAIAAAALLIRAHRRPCPAAADSRQRGGLAIVRSDAVLRPAFLLLAVFILLGAGVNVVEVFLIKQTLHASSGWYGGVGAAWAVGMVLGAQLAGRASGEGRFARTLVLGSVVLSLGLAGYAVVPAAGWLLPFAVLGGVGNGLANVCASTLIVLRTPEAALGRVGAATSAITSSAQVGAYALGGVAAGLLAPRTIFVLAGALGLAAAVAFGRGLVRASSGSGGLGGDLVEEAGHELDPPVRAGDQHVEADRHRLCPGRAETPLEAGDVVVGVDRAGQAEHEAGELRLDAGDRGVEAVQVVHLDQRVGQLDLRAEVPLQQRPAGGRVGLVPAGQVVVDELHRNLLLG